MANLPPPAPGASPSPLLPPVLPSPPPSIPQASDGQPQARSATAPGNGRVRGQEIGGGEPHPAKNKVINRCKESSLGHTITKARVMLELLVHAHSCRTSSCQYTNCRGIKGVVAHAMMCPKRASRGCKACLKLWSLLHLHARACKESKCTIPRCRDLKDMIRRTRRRAAVNEIMRQRAAEATSR